MEALMKSEQKPTSEIWRKQSVSYAHQNPMLPPVATQLQIKKVQGIVTYNWKMHREEQKIEPLDRLSALAA